MPILARYPPCPTPPSKRHNPDGRWYQVYDMAHRPTAPSSVYASNISEIKSREKALAGPRCARIDLFRHVMDEAAGPPPSSRPEDLSIEFVNKAWCALDRHPQGRRSSAAPTASCSVSRTPKSYSHDDTEVVVHRHRQGDRGARQPPRTATLRPIDDAQEPAWWRWDGSVHLVGLQHRHHRRQGARAGTAGKACAEETKCSASLIDNVPVSIYGQALTTLRQFYVKQGAGATSPGSARTRRSARPTSRFSDRTAKPSSNGDLAVLRTGRDAGDRGKP